MGGGTLDEAIEKHDRKAAIVSVLNSIYPHITGIEDRGKPADAGFWEALAKVRSLKDTSEPSPPSSTIE